MGDIINTASSAGSNDNGNGSYDQFDGNLMVNSQKYISPYDYVASINNSNNGNIQCSSEHKIDNWNLINQASSMHSVTPKHPKDSYLQSLENSWQQFKRR